MGLPVVNEEIENSSPNLLSVSGTASVVSDTRLGKARRTFLSIIPVTANTTVTIVLGEQTPVLHSGIDLVQSQPFVQSLDINGRGVYQGLIQAIASGAGQIAVTEIFEY